IVRKVHIFITHSLIETSDILLDTEGEILPPLAFSYTWYRVKSITVIDSQHTEYWQIYPRSYPKCASNLEWIEVFERIPRITGFSKYHPKLGSLVIQHQRVA